MLSRIKRCAAWSLSSSLTLSKAILPREMLLLDAFADVMFFFAAGGSISSGNSVGKAQMGNGRSRST
jgi:hypothetical protein